MQLEHEYTKLRLIEAQMQILQYQHRDVAVEIKRLEDAKAQAKFDAAVDAHDQPSGATKPPNEFAGD